MNSLSPTNRVVTISEKLFMLEALAGFFWPFRSCVILALNECLESNQDTNHGRAQVLNTLQVLDSIGLLRQ